MFLATTTSPMSVRREQVCSFSPHHFPPASHTHWFLVLCKFVNVSQPCPVFTTALGESACFFPLLPILCVLKLSVFVHLSGEKIVSTCYGRLRVFKDENNQLFICP